MSHPAGSAFALLLALVCACAADSGSSGGLPERADASLEDTSSPLTDTLAQEDGAAVEAGARPAVWQPAIGTTWQWQLIGEVDTSFDVEMYDIDLFDVPDALIGELHEAGRIVICYFSAGSHEDWRDDAGAFDAGAVGEPLDDWPGERWLDVRSDNVRGIMRARLELAVARGCDGVEPDNVDGYANATGFDLTRADQIDYNRFLAGEAHGRGLSVGLKNAVELVGDLEPDFDWALNEECLAFDECGALAAFLQAGKAVFHVEYVDSPSEGPQRAESVCASPSIEGFSTLVKTWDLDAFRIACDGSG